MAALSFSGPLHQTGTGIPAGTDEMFDVLHLLSHGASWRTFDFLGFTHCCARTKNGRFMLKRITIAKRMRRKLREVKDELMRRRNHAIPEQGRWLASVLRGHYAYYAVLGNSDRINRFYNEVTRLWLRALRWRSQRHRLPWTRMRRLSDRWLPPPKRMHPFPNARFAAITQGRSPVR